jgi:CheY-like chemotaxis protein
VIRRMARVDRYFCHYSVPLAGIYNYRMTLESLLLSGDRDVEGVLRPTLEKLAIELEICREARSGSEILLAEKFDAVIVDCDDLQGGLALLEGLRATPSNKSSVSFAILNGKKTTTQQAFGMGANFVLQKPISALNATRCFNAALNFMVRERRRYFRQAVKMVVSVSHGNKELKGTSTNVSEGGIALILREALPKGATPRLKFMLPDVNVPFDVEAEVAWADIKGHVGLRFLNVSESAQQALEKWLDEQMASSFPGLKE